ncbi:M28 family peptidase [Catelliglobosispora koreensis]|uniref:M28 family peptidase n=1 Tax=Catelliglobosispora koreensis TaxID=129052 RepID=UPI001FE1261D|nr:M28 family peptidase [Catelliglobosispora koreensis]
MTATATGEPLHSSGSAEPSADRMMEVVARLAADDFAGRQAGTSGGHAAAQWLATHLESLGAAVTVDEFAVTGAVRTLDVTPVLSWTDGASRWGLVHRREFAEHLASTYLPQLATGLLRLMGSGDPAGVWLLDSEYAAERAAQAAAQGALGVVVPRGVDDGGWMPKMVGGPPTAALPVVSVRTDIQQQMTTAAMQGGAELGASVPLRPRDITAVNVHGVFGVAQPGQVSVLLTAHFDGVGDDPNGLRHPAACDNASGVAAVAVAARILAATHPHVGVAVALLDGEESGLHGSARHAPHVPAGTFVINLDGAAALDKPAVVEAGGPAHRLLVALDQAARQTGMPLRAQAMRSDNRRYTAAGLPTVGIGMGMPGYQTPAETPDRVQPEVLVAAVRLLLSTVDKLAASPPETAIHEIGRDELAQLLRDGEIVAVEALPEDVYARGHLPGALNIRPRRVAELAPQLLPDKGAPIAAYCGDAGCDASLRVARHLSLLGYTNVRRYTGGKRDWTQAGLALETVSRCSETAGVPQG